MNRASHSVPPGGGKEQMTKDTCGPTFGKQFAYYDHDSHSWRMWPDTGLWGSIEYSGTWPRTGRMCGGQAFELPTSAHRITGNDYSSSSFLPTPAASDSLRRCTPSEARRKSPTMVAVRVHFPEFIAELTGDGTPLQLDVGNE